MPVVIDAAVRHHHRQPQHRLAHRPVADGGRARGARRGHAADGGVGARIDREGDARVLRSALFNCSRVTPASTVASMSSALTRSMWFISRRSIVMPPWMALTCPSSEVPAPKGMTGSRCARADLQNRGDFVGRAREADDVGRGRRVVRLVVAVLVARRGGIGRRRGSRAAADEVSSMAAPIERSSTGERPRACSQLARECR